MVCKEDVSITLYKVVLVLHLVIGLGQGYLVDMKRLNTHQVEAMAKLRDLMKKEKLEVHPPMMENYNLAKWLNYHNFNVKATCDAIEKNIQWREDEKIENILTEDWTDMLRRFPYTRNTTDKDGRPIMYIDFGKWDVAGYLSEGKKAHDRFIRYNVMRLEETEALVWEWYKAGKFVTQGTVIINLGGFSFQKHACISCLQVYRQITTVFGENYPNTRHRTVGVNTPFLFQVVYHALALPFQTQTVLLGHNRKQWKVHLLESIALDQFPAGLLEPSDLGELQGSKTVPSLYPEPKATIYYKIRQRGATLVDPPFPFLLPSTGLPLPEEILKWKREL